jgi:hypothetical protein
VDDHRPLSAYDELARTAEGEFIGGDVDRDSLGSAVTSGTGELSLRPNATAVE